MPSRPPAATDGTAPDEVALSAMPGWVAAGVGVLFVVACAFGVLEVHYSNDTWIALSAGRQILTEPQFPTKDTFSYTFYGQTWFNQNWLSHVYFWLLYDQLGPTAVFWARCCWGWRHSRSCCWRPACAAARGRRRHWPARSWRPPAATG